MDLGGPRRPGPAPARAAVRLAELVAALSLGVDLGFGQPMEHVLRQCLIALRLAERAGLDDEAGRSSTTRRCWSTWAVTPTRTSRRSGSATTSSSSRTSTSMSRGAWPGWPRRLRLVGRGNPPLHRFRVGLEFALSGSPRTGRDDRAARGAGRGPWRRELGLPGAGAGRGRASYEQWDGRGWPGELRGDAVPVASRLAQLAEYVEVAHRVGGTGGRGDAGPRAVRHPVRSVARAACCAATPRTILGDLDTAQTWDAVIGAEPALGVPLDGEQLDAALLGVANFVDLKSPYTLGHARAVAGYAAAAGGRAGLARSRRPDAAPGRPGARPGPARGVELDLGQARAAGCR